MRTAAFGLAARSVSAFPECAPCVHLIESESHDLECHELRQARREVCLGLEIDRKSDAAPRPKALAKIRMSGSGSIGT